MSVIEYSLDYISFFLKAMTVVIAITLLSFIKQKQKEFPVEFKLINKARLKDTIKNISEFSSEAGKKRQKELKKELKKVSKINDHLFVIDFIGDLRATEIKSLREIVTSIIEIANPGDRVLLKLESPGGEVTAYGLVASQIARFKNKNIHVTVAIDRVAASGGYLIAAVADTIIAAPFAVVGSIGVILQAANVNKLLKKNDIDVVEITAGKYKRTLTMVGENTAEGKAKAQEQIEAIHDSFKTHVTSNRPDIAIDEIANGDIWLAKDAVQHKLVDKIQTSDEFISNALANFKVIKVSKKMKISGMQKLQKCCDLMYQNIFKNNLY